MNAEFDTLADWTAHVARDLGPEFHVPAACRGSGSPAALDWLVDRMTLTAGDLLLDCGAGVGGPAAYAAATHGIDTVLAEPEAGACRAARMLFSHNVVQSLGTALPLKDASFDAAWALGVLCTAAEQRTMLDELRRVVRPGGSIGLLVFVAETTISSDYIEGNHFPTAGELARCLADVDLEVIDRKVTSELPAIPALWSARVDKVTAVLEERYGHTAAWQIADRQSTRIGALLGSGDLHGDLLVVHGRA